VPYALFEDDQKLSSDFATYEDAWRHAEDAGLTDTIGDEVVLPGNYRIARCENDMPLQTTDQAT
jgi:hypothetical protein